MHLLPTILLLLIVPYLLAVFMPSWLWLIGYVLAGGSLIFAWFASVSSASSRYGEAAIGFLFLAPAIVSFTAGILVRSITLIVASRGGSRCRVFLANALGFSIPLAILGATIGWAKWEIRPPSTACAQGAFDIELGGDHWAIPAAPIISIFVGSGSERHEYNFAIRPSLRDFCGLTDDAKQSIQTTKISIRPGLAPDMTEMAAPAFCAAPGDWAVPLCKEIALAKRSRSYESNLPYLVLLHLDEEPNATTAPHPISPGRAEDSVFVKSDSRTPDGDPLTFVCREGIDHRHWCTTSYRWHARVHLTYQIRTKEANLGEKGGRVDAALRNFLEKLLVKDKK